MRGKLIIVNSNCELTHMCRRERDGNNKRGLKYKPYKLQDYKNNFSNEEGKPLGGIGPNVGNQGWRSKSQLREKMINFAKDAEFQNKLRLFNQKPAEKIDKKRRFGVNGPKWEMM